MRRINTQVPRRIKVQPATPMASEWDISTGHPPSELRTPSDKMSAGKSKGEGSSGDNPEPAEKSTPGT